MISKVFLYLLRYIIDNTEHFMALLFQRKCVVPKDIGLIICSQN